MLEAHEELGAILDSMLEQNNCDFLDKEDFLLISSPHSVLENRTPSHEEDALLDISAATGATGDESQSVFGCRLFHLLLAGAESAFSDNLDLTRAILIRLGQLQGTFAMSSSTRPIFHRIAHYFSEGLKSLVQQESGRLSKVNPNGSSNINSSSHLVNTLTAFQVLHEASPYIKFGHYAANQAILEAIGDAKRVHIVDYDVAEGIQWPPLMQALALRQGGPPQVRITALYRPHLSAFHDTKARLVECANSFNIPFSFHQARIEDSKLIGLRLVKGETLLVNCMLHLLHMPHRSPLSVVAFLKAAQKLSPVLVTLVHEHVMDTPSPVEQFLQALHHYSAMLDSLEESLSDTAAHMLVERAFLAARIKTAVTCTLSQSCSQGWPALLHSCGFRRLAPSWANACQAKLLLGLFKDGYRLEEDHINEALMLSWKSRPLVVASIWTCVRLV